MGAQGMEEEGNWEVWVISGDNENILVLESVTVVQYCEFSKKKNF